MPLMKQNFFVSLAKGIDTKTDSKQVLPGRLLLLENGVFISPTEIRKRNGYSALNLSTQNSFTFNFLNCVPSKITSGNFLAAFSQEIVLNDNFNLFSYSEGLSLWVYKSPSTICKTSLTPIIRNTYTQAVPDSAINPAGLQIFAWEDSSDNNVHVSVLDTNTKQIVVNNKVLLPVGGGQTLKPKCTFIGQRLVVFYLDSTVNMALKYVTYAAGVFSSPVAAAANVSIAHNNYDLLVNQNLLYVTYNSSAASIITLEYNFTLVTPGSISQADNANNGVSMFKDSLGRLWVCYATATQAKLFIYNSDLTLALAPTVINGTANIYSITGTVDKNNVSWIFFDVLGTADANGYYSNAQIVAFHVAVDGSVSGGQRLFLKSAGIQSKAFSVDDTNGNLIPHIMVWHDASLQPTYFLCNLINVTAASSSPAATVVAKIAPSSSAGLVTKPSSLSTVNLISEDIFQMALLQKDLLFTAASSAGTVNTFSAVGVISSQIDFSQTNLQTQTLGNNLHIGSGMLGMYDGATVVEHGFHLYPEALSGTVNAGAGNLGMGTFGYQITYEWVDNQGQLHRSAPSPVLSFTTGNANNTIDLTIPTLRITSKANVNIVIYRTKLNGTVYFRLAAPTSPLLNDTTANTVTYHDNIADSSIGANEQLYTTGGEVVNISAPGSSIIGEFKNRVVLVPNDNPYSWWFSKQVIPGSPVEFSNEFVENIGTDGGPITSFLQMDSNAIFFKEDSIFYVVGDGPSPAGTNNDFTEALSIASDVGCINSQSMVLMPSGVIFKSNKGIYLLTRGLEVKYIGADVEAYNSFSVTSAQLISYTNQIRFTLSNGIALVYDYFVNQWSVFTNINALSSIITGETFSFVLPNGTVWQETPGQFNDIGSPISLKLTTSWLSLAGIQGFQRIYKSLLLGQYSGPHQLLVEFAYDFNPTVVQQTYIDATSVLNPSTFGADSFYGINSPFGGNFPLYQWRIFTKRQVCQSIQISIRDVPFAGPYVNIEGQTVQAEYNESMSLSAITLELGVKKGAQKPSAKRSFG